jgi:hypothetical protein
VDRIRHPRSRAEEVAAVRRRLAAAPGPGAVGAEQLERARAIRRLKQALSAAFGAAPSCSGCARGHPLPHGRWNGGHCCGGQTELVFNDVEVEALRLSGTSPARLVLPRPSDHAGCAFRGPDGCSLDVADRPGICVQYICRELEAELRGRGDFTVIKALRAELRAALERFARQRAGAPAP